MPALTRLACLLALLPLTPTGFALAQGQDPAPTHRMARGAPIKDRYIVVFKSEVQDAQREAETLVRGVGNGRLHHVFSGVLKGFAATVPAQALPGLRRNPRVDYIEPDMSVQLNQMAQNNATWGLDRIDQADRPLDTQYRYLQSGAGVHAFVLDTGVRSDHVEFTGRVLTGYTAIGDGRGTWDCNGHGTHVAGTVAGSTWGVAKQARIVPVRVLDCAGSGAYSGIIAGLDWAAASPLRPAVANLSLGGPLSGALNQAVAGAVGRGLTVVVAAGNENVDACTRSPGAEPSALTVGATTSGDQRASYSNFGTCVDVFAPGSGITSASYASATGAAIMNGTSMAAPHVAGVAALALQANPEASPAAVADFIRNQATVNRLASLGTGSPNRLLYSMAAASVAPLPTRVVAVRSLTASAARVSFWGQWSATVTVSLRDVATSAAVANAQVTASFSPGTSVSCVTSSAGSCSFKSSTYSYAMLSTVLTVTGVAGSNLAYDASQNAATRLTVNRP